MNSWLLFSSCRITNLPCGRLARLLTVLPGINRGSLKFSPFTTLAVSIAATIWFIIKKRIFCQQTTKLFCHCPVWEWPASFPPRLIYGRKAFTFLLLCFPLTPNDVPGLSLLFPFVGGANDRARWDFCLPWRRKWILDAKKELEKGKCPPLAVAYVSQGRRRLPSQRFPVDKEPQLLSMRQPLPYSSCIDFFFFMPCSVSYRYVSSMCADCFLVLLTGNVNTFQTPFSLLTNASHLFHVSINKYFRFTIVPINFGHHSFNIFKFWMFFWRLTALE